MIYDDFQSNDSSNMCLELALEGERLCKTGDCRAGVAFFQVRCNFSEKLIFTAHNYV